jgi:hypothetical protein
MEVSLMDEGLEVVHSHLAVFFSRIFAFILVFTVKCKERVLLIDIISKLLLLVLMCNGSLVEELVHLSLVLRNQIEGQSGCDHDVRSSC